MKRSEKQLPSKENSSIFLQLSCSNLRLKLCGRAENYQNSHKKASWKGSETN